jgi:branched-chain amino acid aminotransferase
MIGDDRAERMQTIAGLAAWRNGELVTAADATVSMWDHGFLYGDGVFEGLRLRAGRLYRVQDHLARLRRSVRMLGLELAYSDTELIAGIRDVAHAIGIVDAHVRIVVTRGIGLPGLDPRNCERPTTIILAYPFPPTFGDEPITLMISSVVKKAPRSADPAAKTLNYLDQILGKLQGIAAGADDAILLDGDGFVAEATASNIFLVEAGVLSTPECTSALPGITRKTVLELASSLGIPVEIKRITPGALYAADEAFLTGTGSGIVSVGVVDGRALASAPGDITRAVGDRYRATWVDPDYTIEL